MARKSIAKPAPDWDRRIGSRIKLRDLHILSVVVRNGSMVRAAGQLATSQSVISEAIASLEHGIGVRLLDRNPHGVEPTIYATTLLKRGNVVFDELRQGIKDIEALADSTAGEVRIACTEFLAAGLITDTVDNFCRRFPNATCNIADLDSTTLEYRQLHERSVDLIVTRIPTTFADDDVDAEVLFDDPHLVVAGAESAWATRRQVTLADVVNEPWIVPASLVVNAILQEAFEAEGLKIPAESVTTSFILMRNRLMASGRFLTVLPESVLHYNAKQWSLRALPIKLRTKPRPIALLTLKNRTVNPLVKRFIEQLRMTAKNFARQRR